MGFPGGSVVKNLPADAGNAGDVCSIPGSGRSPGAENGRSPGAENSNPHQYSYLENSMDRGAWWATVHEVAESDITEKMNTYTHCNKYQIILKKSKKEVLQQRKFAAVIFLNWLASLQCLGLKCAIDRSKPLQFYTHPHFHHPPLYL